jgi:hypothetical protein
MKRKFKCPKCKSRFSSLPRAIGHAYERNHFGDYNYVQVYDSLVNSVIRIQKPRLRTKVIPALNERKET